MADIKKWFQPEITKKAIYEGIYPVVITAAKAFTKEAKREDDSTFQREVIALTFKTLTDVPFPDKTTGRIVVEQNYYFDVQMHKNALNGIARAFGVDGFCDTDQFEGKTGLIGIINREYQNHEGETKTIAQCGFGLFSYAPMCENAQVEYIANEIDHKPSDEEYKEWFKKHLASYKAPK